MGGHEWEVRTSPLAYSGWTVATINYREERREGRIVLGGWEVNLKGGGGGGLIGAASTVLYMHMHMFCSCHITCIYT